MANQHLPRIIENDVETGAKSTNQIRQWPSRSRHNDDNSSVVSTIPPEEIIFASLMNLKAQRRSC